MSINENALSKYEKETVTFGYIRQYAHYSIPVAINKLCLHYFDEIFYISIRGNTLKQFINMTDDEYIETNFKYNNNISFSCLLYPNENGNTMFYIRALFKTLEIKGIAFSFEMECKHTHTQFIACHIHDTYYGWRSGCMKLLQYKNDKILNNLIFTI
eukprot:539133_1